MTAHRVCPIARGTAAVELEQLNPRQFERFRDFVYAKSGMADGFPPDEVIAACIGNVPVSAAYDKQPNPGSILGYDIVNWRYVYHDVFGKPETAVPVRSLPGHVYAKAWSDYDRIEDWDAEPRAKRLRRQLTPVFCE